MIKSIRKNITVYKEVPFKKEVTIFVTSDGREWREDQKSLAEEHQSLIEDNNLIFDKFQYEEIGITVLPESYHAQGYHSKSFTFVITEETEHILMIKPDMMKKRFSNIIPYGNISIGKYICIEYIKENNDYADTISGYFGKIEEYIALLQETINESKTLLNK